jgi:uncharacterized protein (TIGR02466 family)
MIVSKPFYTPLFSLYTERDFASELTPYILSLRNTEQSLTVSNVGGWHSGTRLGENIHNEDKTVVELLTVIGNAMSVVYKTIGIGKEPTLSNYWFMVNEDGDYNLQHKHSGSYMSGVVYLKAPKDSGSLRLYRPDNLRIIMDPDIIENNEFNYPYWQYEPEDNLVVIFPSTIDHAVMQNKSGDTRIAMSFNYK